MPSPPCRVLVLEDEWLIADQIQRALRDHGFDVVGPVGRLAEALEVVDRENLDAAVLDINIHGERSYPLARRLLRDGASVLFVSGYTRGELPVDLRAVAVLHKPVLPEELSSQVALLLAARAAGHTAPEKPSTPGAESWWRAHRG